MEEEVLDYYNILAIRNQLSTKTQQELNELYEDKGAYLAFLGTVGQMFNNDSGFIYLDESFMDKISNIIQIHRFDFDEKIVKQYINELISFMNSTKTIQEPLKKAIVDNYIIYHEVQREAFFPTQTEFITSLAMDAVVFTVLKEGQFDLIRDYNYALMSLNYLMKTCPEMFKDEEINKRAQQLLEIVDKNTKKISIKKLKLKSAKKNYLEMNENNML